MRIWVRASCASAPTLHTTRRLPQKSSPRPAAFRLLAAAERKGCIKSWSARGAAKRRRSATAAWGGGARGQLSVSA